MHNSSFVHFKKTCFTCTYITFYQVRVEGRKSSCAMHNSTFVPQGRVFLSYNPNPQSSWQVGLQTQKSPAAVAVGLRFLVLRRRLERRTLGLRVPCSTN